MAEIQLVLDIRDADGNSKYKQAVAVPEDISGNALINALRGKYGDVLGDNPSILLEWPLDEPASVRKVKDGTTVIIRANPIVRFL